MENPADTLRAGAFILERERFSALLKALSEFGYQVLGPVMKDGAIVYDEILSDKDLPAGWTDEQAPGSYALKKREDDALFGYVVGPHSWKKYLHPPERVLWRAKRTDDGFDIREVPQDERKRAFLGVRACEIAAIDIQTRVFLHDQYVDQEFESRRNHALLIAVNCAEPADTCFCASMNAGPEVTGGHDIVMTELAEPGRHVFVMEAATEPGAAVIRALSLRNAEPEENAAARAVSRRARQSMKRSLETQGLREFLQDNPEHPQWDDVASRCLSCTNCTAVCPTCFCTTAADRTDLSGHEAERVQHWDSCFSGEFSELGGGPVRRSTKSRYRQWMTHKLSTWIDQFGVSGCVGCGRCIAWCPAGIDITKEAAAMRAAAGATDEDS